MVWIQITDSVINSGYTDLLNHQFLVESHHWDYWHWDLVSDNFERAAGIGPVIIFSAKSSSCNWWLAPQLGGIWPESLLDDNLIHMRFGYTPKCSDISPASWFLWRKRTTRVEHVLRLFGIEPSNIFEDRYKNLRLWLVHKFVGKGPDRMLLDKER